MKNWVLVLGNGPDQQLNYEWFNPNSEGDLVPVGFYPPNAESGDSIYFTYNVGGGRGGRGRRPSQVQLSGNPPIDAGTYDLAPTKGWTTDLGGYEITNLDSPAGTPLSFTVTIGSRKIDPQMNVSPSKYSGTEPVNS